MEVIKEKILRLLVHEQLKPNKLRKKVMDSAMKESNPDLTWDDFTTQLKVLEESKQVTRKPDPSDPKGELCCLPTSDDSTLPKPQERKKRPLEVTVKKAVRVEDEGAVESENSEDKEKKSKLQVTIDLPEKFIPFLLRQEGAKLKNIEVNSKTKIQCDQRKSQEPIEGRAVKNPGTNLSGLNLPNEGAGDEETRTIVITGVEEKHLKTAQILINSMLNAFHKNANPNFTKDKKKYAGKGNWKDDKKKKR